MPMIEWARTATDLLSRSDLRILTTDDLRAIATKAFEASGGQGDFVLRTFRRWIDAVVAAGHIVQIQRGLYGITGPGRYLHPNEVAGRLRHSAIVSLQSVLGESGALNNSSRIVFAVVDAAEEGTRPRQVDTAIGDFHFLAMRPATYAAGDLADRLDVAAGYPKATAERAFCDWIYFGYSKAHETIHPPPLDLDLSGLDDERVNRLAKAMEIEEPLAKWRARKAKADQDADFDEQVSSRMGL